MAALLFDDGIVSTSDPAMILVVSCPDGVERVKRALTGYSSLLKIDACGDLASGIVAARTEQHDVIVLCPELPDSWPADAYERLQSAAEGLPILVVTADGDDSGAPRRGSTLPFCVIEGTHADPLLIRRLIISAALFKRARGGLAPASEASAGDKLRFSEALGPGNRAGSKC